MYQQIDTQTEIDLFDGEPVEQQPQVEETTSGLEDIIDWDDLETALMEGHFATKRAFREHVDQLLGEGATRTNFEATLDGLFPEYRAIYNALPIEPTGRKLNRDNVIEIRRRHADGETQDALGIEFGVRQNTINDLVQYRTWKDVAA